MAETAAARQFVAWLEAFNSDDRAAYRAFVEGSAPARRAHLDDEWGLREMTGGFDLRKAEDSTATRFVALVEERSSDRFARLTLEVEATAPHRVTGLEVRAVERPAEFALPHMSEAELLAALAARLEQEAAADRFAGAALVAHGGVVRFARAYGLADRERAIANTLETRFRLGSMNKMFTAVAILKLVEAGEVSLDDPVGRHLTDYRNQDVASKVTVRHLLTHTGGTGDFFGPEFDAHRLELRRLQDYADLFGERAPAFEPGSRFEYSNYGFILLGLIIEHASGEDYDEHVDRHIFRPAGMTATGSEPEDRAVPERSVGYTRVGGTWRRNEDTLPYRGTSAGGGYSTVGDLLAFAMALEQHRLLGAAATERLTTGVVEAGTGRYALGFTDQIVNGTRCFGHGGGAPGMSGDLRICPGPGYVVAVLANMDPDAAGAISRFVVNRLPQQAPAVAAGRRAP